MPPLLQVENLRVSYPGARGRVRAVDGLSLAIEAGETYALVGESGCGKSSVALAVPRLVEPGRIDGGRIVFEGRDLTALSEREMCRVRGARVGVIFQEPAAALDPVMRVGAQVAEALRAHHRMSRREADREAVRWLGLVALPEPERQARAWPHELSGGMLQRAMLAIALSCRPALVIADEPTSALDVTIQAQVLGLLGRLKAELGLTLLLISHDLALVAENADRVGVMYAGRLAEEGPAGAVLQAPRHPYTRGLLRSVPGAGDPAAGRRLATLPGAPPDPSRPPDGCRFHPRCTERIDPCATAEPPEHRPAPGQRVACWLHGADRVR